jgi:hypothetical protein
VTPRPPALELADFTSSDLDSTGASGFRTYGSDERSMDFMATPPPSAEAPCEDVM